MQPTIAQPHATPISDDLVTTIVRHAAPGVETGALEVDRHGQFSNDLAVVTIPGGRRLMVKRGRHPWSTERFAVARSASRLLRADADIVAPEPLDLPPDLGQAPVEAYWRIELPLLADLWPTLDNRQLKGAMHSLGGLVRRVHSALRRGEERLADRHLQTLTKEALYADLEERMRGAVRAAWPEALAVLDQLVVAMPELFSAPMEPVPLHGDLHLGNVLCRLEGEDVECVGLIDLEWAHFGPAESDLARFRVMHAGPFQMTLQEEAFDWLAEGYGGGLDPELLTFFSVYHYLNLGFYSALIGHDWHAREVARAAADMADELRHRPPAKRQSSMTPAVVGLLAK